MSRSLSQYRLKDRWRFLAPLGEGSDGRVYLVRDDLTGEDAAVKVYNSLVGQPPEAVREQMALEASLSNVVTSPYLVKVQDHGTARAQGGVEAGYIVMEYLAGHSLREVLEQREGKVDLSIAIDIVLHVLAALAPIHDAGYCHLDLKPENIFVLSSRGRAQAGVPLKLLDFGAIRSGSGALTRWRGTPLYAAPELCQRSERTSGQADLYSMGIVLYELLVGRPPLPPGTPESIVAQHVWGALDPMPPPWAQHPVAEVYARATTRDLNVRYGSAREFAAGLSAVPRVLSPEHSGQGVSSPGVSAPGPAGPGQSRFTTSRFHVRDLQPSGDFETVPTTGTQLPLVPGDSTSKPGSGNG